jgi:hypothetical protein
MQATAGLSLVAAVVLGSVLAVAHAGLWTLVRIAAAVAGLGSLVIVVEHRFARRAPR